MTGSLMCTRASHARPMTEWRLAELSASIKGLQEQLETQATVHAKHQDLLISKTEDLGRHVRRMPWRRGCRGQASLCVNALPLSCVEVATCSRVALLPAST